MRQILCEACGREQQLREGARLALPGGSEPAEFERVVWGIAVSPTAEQRTMWVNGVPFPMGASEYNCDRCNAPIRPGERCCAWSAWVEGRPEPPWEAEYLTPDNG